MTAKLLASIGWCALSTASILSAAEPAVPPLPPLAAEGPATGYYRFPAAAGDTLVFTAEGDLWTAPIDGGAARRLTSHAGEETEAAISPDGTRVAFAASYDGGVEAYVMPLAGGTPKRVSFDGTRVYVQGWTPRGEVLYASSAQVGPGWRRVLRAVDPATLATRTLPLDDAIEGAFDPASQTVYFTRLGLQLTNDNARRYRGGALARLWRWDGGDAEAMRIVPRPASAGDAAATGLADGAQARPMWWQGRLYFVGDGDGTHNVWSMNADGSDARQHTRHRGWDVRGARLDAASGRIVYQLGADIHRLDLADGSDHLLPLTLNSDLEQRRERFRKDPLDYLSTVTFGPHDRHVVITTRGQMAKVAPGPERRVEIAVPQESRARAGVASVDGKFVYAIVDSTGEQEIWRFPADGSASGAKALTSDGVTQRWKIVPSPDGRYLAHDDKRGRLWLLDLDSGANSEIDRGPGVGDDVYASIVWSADSKTLALTRPDSARGLNQVLLYSLPEKKLTRLTSDRYESFAPAFSRDGKWLYFLSNRRFAATPSAPWGDRNLGPMFDRRTQVFAYALVADARFPFRADDELEIAKGADKEDGKPDSEPEKAEADKKADGKKEPPKAAAIAWEGLAERLYEVPLEAGNYRALAADPDRLYLLAETDGDGSDLKTLAIRNDGPKPDTFASGVREFALSGDAKKLFYRTGSADSDEAGDLYIVAAGAKAPDGGELRKAQVRVGDWILNISPAREWRQMFHDAWRMHRDFLFDQKLRGVDWTATRKKFEPLVARLTDRSELDDLLGQMTGELGILHSQIRPGETRKDGETAVGAGLGARFARVANGARIEHLYRTEPELPSARGPLARPEVGARVGDVLVAVNGRPVTSVDDVSVLLQNQAGQQVLLAFERAAAGSAPATTFERVVSPIPLDRENTLRYLDWVEGNRIAVERASAGRFGYLHLRAMGGGDIATFARDFYANVEKQGLILDVRRNRGGNIESWVIEKLLRRTWAFWGGHEQTAPNWNMQQTFRGHLVVLIDQLTYSDGETFAAAVKALELGPLVGMRTAGAGVWLSDRNALSDRGMARAAEFGQYAADGRWIIEGQGVAPDIEVDNPPHASFLGKDAQLDAALAYLETKVKDEPVVDPKLEAIPSLGTAAKDVR
jgi:tricorn protease